MLPVLLRLTQTSPDRWKEGREKSRGVRRVLRWFWLTQLAAIVLIGIYFLTRGQALEDAREANASVETPSVAATGDENTFQPVIGSPPDLIVTDETLSHRPKWEALEVEPNPLTFCENTKMRVANSSNRPLNLEGSVMNSDISWTIGVVKPGEQIDFNVGEEGMLALADLTDGEPITRFDVAKCDAAGKFMQ
ncbi:hypothetical protein [Novosphingobium gossypii]|uniref:hypothetical protein n=1 Tax=Novosphingobium gossypii TaxID=1604774 RepID=UPI003D226C4F